MPGAIGIDAFTVDWYGVNRWIVPPVCIVAKVTSIQYYLKPCRAYGTVVLPCWHRLASGR